MLKAIALPIGLLLFVAEVSFFAEASAEDWPGFLGPGGAATSSDDSIPVTWGDDKNLNWKTEMPGAGSSSPIVVGDSVFVTSYSGYGVDGQGNGGTTDLIRHLVCVDRKTGDIRWQKAIPNESREDSYQGYLTEHGYASGTPVSDAEHVYCFFGKSGVVAFDMAGKQLWKTNVGQESSDRQWGSGASFILYEDKVFVNASEESQAMVALNKNTGEVVWRKEASALNLTFATPTMVQINQQRSDLVIAVPGELWAFDPDDGKLLWYVEHDLTGNISPSVIVGDDRVFVFGGYRSAGSLAVRPGGKGDMTDKSVIWSSRNSSYVATPVLHDGYLYWISDRGQAYCASAETGEQVYRNRIPELNASGRPVYASPVVVGDKIYVVTRHDGVLVLAAKPQYELLAQNKFSNDESDFNATVAVSDGQLFIRSDRFLYCVSGR